MSYARAGGELRQYGNVWAPDAKSSEWQSGMKRAGASQGQIDYFTNYWNNNPYLLSMYSFFSQGIASPELSHRRTTLQNNPLAYYQNKGFHDKYKNTIDYTDARTGRFDPFKSNRLGFLKQEAQKQRSRADPLAAFNANQGPNGITPFNQGQRAIAQQGSYNDSDLIGFNLKDGIATKRFRGGDSETGRILNNSYISDENFGKLTDHQKSAYGLTWDQALEKDPQLKMAQQLLEAGIGYRNAADSKGSGLSGFVKQALPIALSLAPLAMPAIAPGVAAFNSLRSGGSIPDLVKNLGLNFIGGQNPLFGQALNAYNHFDQGGNLKDFALNQLGGLNDNLGTGVNAYRYFDQGGNLQDLALMFGQQQLGRYGQQQFNNFSRGTSEYEPRSTDTPGINPGANTGGNNMNFDFGSIFDGFGDLFKNFNFDNFNFGGLMDGPGGVPFYNSQGTGNVWGGDPYNQSAGYTGEHLKGQDNNIFETLRDFALGPVGGQEGQASPLSLLLDYIGSQQGGKTIERHYDKAAKGARYDPYNVYTPGGSARFDEDGAHAGISQQRQQMADILNQISKGAFKNVSTADPYKLADEQMGRDLNYLDPYREREVERLLTGQFGKGTLNSINESYQNEEGEDTGAGNNVLRTHLDAKQRQNQQLWNNSLNRAYDYRNQDYDLGASALAKQLGIENSANDLLGLGSDMGARRATAGYNSGTLTQDLGLAKGNRRNDIYAMIAEALGGSPNRDSIETLRQLLRDG